MKTIFVFSGPSGAGKSTLINFILERFDHVGATVSCTTRQKREDEIDGKDYYFISDEEFDRLVKNEEFLEHVECYKNKYGTLKSAVFDVLKTKECCILDLDFAGAHKILSGDLFHDIKSVGILILPPSLKVLKKRLILRGSETDETLQTRLDKSFSAKKVAAYDHVIINRDLETAKSNLLALLEQFAYKTENAVQGH